MILLVRIDGPRGYTPTVVNFSQRICAEVKIL
jgi:hypothetical protein